MKELGEVKNEPVNIDELFESVKATFKYSMKTMNPFF